MRMSGRLRSLILERAAADNLKECAVEQGMQTLRHGALAHVANGTTSVDEALRNT
jgi:type II secretory ATPase GspE/PulE/Tfp pilus assembly ATPase PilB-like protein